MLGPKNAETIPPSKIIEIALGTLSFSTISGGLDGISSSADATAITFNSSEQVGIGQSSPSNKLQIDTVKNKLIPTENVSNIVNGFDLNAVELALRFSENHEYSSVTIISIGNNLTSDVIKKPIAMGADEIITCEDPLIEETDILGTSLILSKIIRKTGPYDIIFCGRHASDFDNASVPFGLSENLSIPIVNIVKDIKIQDQKLQMERVITDGFQKVEAETPVIVTTGNQVGDYVEIATEGKLKWKHKFKEHMPLKDKL